MEELIKILEVGFSLIGALIMGLILVLYIKLSNIEDIIHKKFEKEENDEK